MAEEIQEHGADASGRKLIVCCGGTGGHFYPGLSIARAFAARGGTVELFISGKRAATQSEIAAENNVPCRILSDSPLPSGASGMLRFALALPLRLLECRRLLKAFKPDCVLGMGSFNSVPAALAARSLGIPLFLHDGNSFVGRANLMLSRLAVKLALAFPAANHVKIKCPCEITGMPLRPEISPEHVAKKYGGNPKSAAGKVFGTDFAADIPLILIFGGSQGAAVFNERLPEALGMIGNDNFQVVHITGKGNKEKVDESYASLKVRHLVIEETPEIGLLYSAADLVICRAGGSTVAELALFGKYSILIPFPHASDDHQRANAEFYTSAGSSALMDEKECKPAELARAILDFLSRRAGLIEKALASKTLSSPHAADNVINMMFRDLHGE